MLSFTLQSANMSVLEMLKKFRLKGRAYSDVFKWSHGVTEDAGVQSSGYMKPNLKS